MKKINLISIFVLILSLNLTLTSCLSKKKVENKPRSPIEQVTLMCYVNGIKDKQAHWIFTDIAPLECPNWSDPFIVEDSMYLWALRRLDYTGIAKVQIDVNSSIDALYFERSDNMKMTKVDKVYVSYGEKGVVQYGMINEKLYVKKITADEMISVFPKNIRDTLSKLGIYILKN